MLGEPRIPRTPSAPGFFNFPNVVEKARGLYAALKEVVDTNKSKTHKEIDTLAKAIFHTLDKKLIYQFDLTDLSFPYKVEEVEKRIDLGLFEMLPMLSRWNCMLLINQDDFTFYLKQQQTIHELTIQTLNIIETKQFRNNPYVIIFSTTCLSHQLKMTDVWLDHEQTKGKFYHFCPPHLSSVAKAPFHHEAQPESESSLCGLHALNAYIGYHHLSPQTLGEYILPWLREAGSPILTRNFDIKKFEGFDATLLRYVIDQIAKSGKISGVNRKAKIIVCSCKPSLLSDKFSEHEMKLKEDFNHINRFILGVSKTQAHFLAFRKDRKGKWWMIDSKLGKQEAYENSIALVDAIKETYPNDLLHFIMPDHNEKILPA